MKNIPRSLDMESERVRWLLLVIERLLERRGLERLPDRDRLRLAPEEALSAGSVPAATVASSEALDVIVFSLSAAAASTPSRLAMRRCAS